MGKTIITLDYPITIAGVTVNQIALRRPRVRDITAVEHIKGDKAQEIAMIANLSENAVADIEELDLGDYKKIQEAFGGFF